MAAVLPHDSAWLAEYAARAEQTVAGLADGAAALAELGSDPSTWFHSFTLSDGSAVRGVKPLEFLQAEFDAFFGPVPFTGRTVLDIGSWNGAFAFEARRRGAKQVLATDLWTWTDPGCRGLEKFLFIRKDSGLDVDYKLIDVVETNPETVGYFDVVLFLGVFYHLQDPLSCLQRLAAVTRDCLIMETYLDLEDLPYPAMRYYPGSELNNDWTNWWGPNRQCIEALLRTAGFAEVKFRDHPIMPKRGIFHARRRAE